MGAIGTWLVSLAGPAIRQILLSMGIGLASYAALSTVLTSAINAAKAAFAGFTGDALGLLMLSGVNEAMSIVAGALIARVAMSVVKKFEVIK